VQPPIEHAYGQALAVVQLPVESHVSTPLPEHLVDPGAQIPVHMPEAHAWLVHGWAGLHEPVTSHRWTASPLH
jgi:hypothetical protein